MKIGLIPMAAKPYHAGHDQLVRLVANECHAVKLFVSLSDRMRPGELPIYGKDMEVVWKRFIEKSLPENCLTPVYTSTSAPVGEMIKFLVEQEKTLSNDTFVIYSDEEDIKQYTDEKLEKYVPVLFAAGQVLCRGVSRNETVNVSGTKMRAFIANGDITSFSKYLPKALQPYSDEVLSILTHHSSDAVSLQEVYRGRKTETLAKRVANAIIAKLKSTEILNLIRTKRPAQTVIDSEDLPGIEKYVEYIQLDFSFSRQLGMQEVATTAAFIKSDFAPRIEVEITYPNRPFRLDDIADIYPEILENLRHELEHATQSFTDEDQSSPDSLNTFEDFVRYYTDPTEVEAFVAGLMAKAKSGRLALSKLIDDKVDAIIVDAEDAGIADDDIEMLDSKLRSAYLAYARKRYRNMK